MCDIVVYFKFFSRKIRSSICSLTCHRLSTISLFCANLLGSQKKQLLKYCPLTPVNSIAVAQ